jgi:hypothetical protein
VQEIGSTLQGGVPQPNDLALSLFDKDYLRVQHT